MYIRPVTLDDHAAILGLAGKAGFGMTSLPPDAGVLRAKIEKAVKSFAGKPDSPGDESYLFALVDPAAGTVVGVAGVKAKIGLSQPFYSYKISTITQASRELDLFTRHRVLNVVNDFTGASELGPLFVLPEYRRDGIGAFLSRMRFLFMVEFRERFSEQVISEIRGVSDEGGDSPFYDCIARSFFQMEFSRADRINATRGNQFIADLMPKYPIYVNLLPKPAQEVIGKPHPASVGAKGLLEREGFRWKDYVDIFDGGPTLEVRRDDIRTVRESRRAVVAEISARGEGEHCLIGTTGFAGFRATLCRARGEPGAEEDRIILPACAAEALEIEAGATVRWIRA